MSKYLISTVLLTLFSVGSIVIHRGFSFEVAKPTVSLAEFPREFRGWKGTEEEFSDGVEDILDSYELLSLKFQRGLEGPIFVHAATWISPDSVAETCPHHPDICYRGNGWTPAEKKFIDVSVADGKSIPVQVTSMVRGEQKVTIAFCYQMGANYFADEGSARKVQLGMFGTRVWPPVTKFMIQTPHERMDDAELVIREFVKGFFDWNRNS